MKRVGRNEDSETRQLPKKILALASHIHDGRLQKSVMEITWSWSSAKMIRLCKGCEEM